MRYNRFFRTLALAVILALLMIAIPVTPALAAERISVTPTSGEIDDYVDIDCSGFTAAEDVYFYFSSEDADVGDDIDYLDAYENVEIEYDCDTSFSVYFYVPDELRDGDDREDVVSGDYYVYAAYADDEIVAVDDFRVIAVELSISPDEGVVGTEVRVDGSGFEYREDIEIKFGGSTVEISRGDDDTDSDGDFTSYFIVPEAPEGDHTITVEVNGDEAEDEFTVEPDMTISPASGIVGDRVTVTGTGFADSEDITITFDGEEVATDDSDSDGSFEIDFTVPEVGPGTYDVEAEDESNNSVSADFTISTNVSISPTTSVNSPGYVGMDLTISGTGFIANHEITITYTSEPVVFTTTSGADGSFSYTFTVPPSTGGEHTITATDGTSTMDVTFVMESTPPAIPPPLLPMMGDKADSEAYFDWEDVTDDSLPVTYELQIATDAEFTNLLVDQTELTTSEYTLTEEEKLESTDEEAPYYWRIRAVDAASNASGWTGAGTFTVGFSFGFELTGWVLYVVIAVGAVIVFFVGLWVGRRTGGFGEEY
jgi:hypothetical protein